MTMKHGLIKGIEVKHLLKNNLMDNINSGDVSMESIDDRYFCERYASFIAEEL